MTLSEEDFRDLQEQEQALADMTATDGWAVLATDVEDKARKMYDDIVSGRLTHDQYIEQTAWLKGARYVTAMPLRKQLELHEQREQMAELVDP